MDSACFGILVDKTFYGYYIKYLKEETMKRKKKDPLAKMRIGLPKQRNQAFKVKTKYDRKNKNWKNDSCSSFI